MTRQLLATDHNLTLEQLKIISQRVADGLPVEVPEEVLKANWVRKEVVDRANRKPLGCVLLEASLILLVVGLSFLVILLFLKVL